jgi:hemerythrin-like domain-containing protein
MQIKRPNAAHRIDHVGGVEALTWIKEALRCSENMQSVGLEGLGLMNVAQRDCGGSDPLAVIEEDHALHLELCDILEYLADNLPDCSDPALARIATAFLRRGFPIHLRREEHVLSRLLERHGAKVGYLRPVVQHLKAEHAADERAALEIADELQVLAEQGRVANADMLGYMLRGFFEAQRRHVWWEGSVLLPRAREVLTPADLAELQAWIMSSEWPACSRHSLAELRRMNAGDVPCERCAARVALAQNGGKSG